HARPKFDHRIFAHFFQQAIHLFAAHFLMRHFAAAVENHGLDLMPFAKEPDDLIPTHLEIVFGGGRPELHFFQLRGFLMFPLLVLLFAFLIQEFAVVGNLAHRRIGRRRNLNEVQSPLARHLNRLERLHHSQLPAFFIYDANFPRPDLIIYPDSIIRPKTSLGDKPSSTTLVLLKISIPLPAICTAKRKYIYGAVSIARQRGNFASGAWSPIHVKVEPTERQFSLMKSGKGYNRWDTGARRHCTHGRHGTVAIDC